MPSKLLVAVGEAIAAVRRVASFGVRVAEPQIDGRAVMAACRPNATGSMGARLRRLLSGSEFYSGLGFAVTNGGMTMAQPKGG